MIHINELLGNNTCVRLLQHFADHPGSEWGFRQLKKELEIAPATLAKGLGMLEKKKLITHRQLGNMKPYKLQKDNPLVKSFKILQAVEELLLLENIGARFDCHIYLFGSRARGEDTEQSDVDLLVIAESKHSEVQSSIEQERRKMKKMLVNLFNVHMFTNLEWANMSRKDPAFYERVEKDKIQIC